MDNTDKFSGKAEIYDKSRPDYSTGLIEYLSEKFDTNTSIADIGSGTGKLAKEFLKRDCKVFCVEPNKDMRTLAEKILSEYNGFVSVNGTDTNTNLTDNSVDLITVAQAFHWFDVDGFKTECQRILKPNGMVAIVYNHRVTGSDFVNENAEICKKFCPNFKGFSNKFSAEAMAKIDFLFDNEYKTIHFANNLIYSKDLFIERMLSASYSPTQNDLNFNEYVTALENLFDKYSENGVLILPNETIAYVGTV